MFRNKADSIAWAQKLDAPNIFYILDFESTDRPDFKTGYFPEPLSIAIIRCNGLRNSHEVAMNQLIKPQGKIADGAKAVHGIDEKALADKPSFRDIYLDVAKLLHKETVIAYNAGFETPVLAKACEQYKLPCIEPKFSCAMLAYSAFNGELNQWGKPKWWKLSEACANHGIATDNAHDAATDCVMTYELIKVMAKG